MAKAITGTFTITSRVRMNAIGYQTTTIPIGSLIDVGDAQALEVESVDFIYQNYDSGTDTYEPVSVNRPFNADSSFGCQLMDRNADTFIAASDNNLISSSAVQYDSQNVVTAATDFYPDDFQKTNGRFVVNDEMYLVGYIQSAAQASQNLEATVRIRAKVVKLSTRDWMAISLETVQNE